MRVIFSLLMMAALMSAEISSAEVTTRLEISGDMLILSYSDSRDAVIFRRNDSGNNVPPMKIDIPGKWTLDSKPKPPSAKPPEKIQPSGKTLPPGVVGETYSHTLKASRRGARFSASGLPEGLKISSSGKITGSPKKAGVFTVVITEQIRSRREKNTFTLSISEPKEEEAAPVPESKPKSPDISAPEAKSLDITPHSRDIRRKRPLRISTSSIRQAFTGEEFTFTLETAGNERAIWSCDFLPEGLSLDSETGIISGVPVSDFREKINVTAMNDNGRASRDILFSVKTRRPKITTSALPEGFVSEDYTAELHAENGNVITWSFRGKIPDGLSFSKEGVIHGVPEEAGQFTVNASAQNSGGKASRRFSLRVFENVPHEYVTAAIIPAFTVSDDGRYDFTVSIDENIPEGSYIEWHSFPYGIESDGEIYTFKDSADKEIMTVPANHRVTANVYLEGGVRYEPLITARVITGQPKTTEPAKADKPKTTEQNKTDNPKQELPPMQGTYTGCNMAGILSMIILVHTIKKRGAKS